MKISEAGEPCHFLVQARIVLHRAGAERIEPRVDRIVHSRQPDEMAHDLRLRQTGQTDRMLALQSVQPPVGHSSLRDIDSANAFPAEFEQQRFFVVESAVARNRLRVIDFDLFNASGAADRVHRHERISASALANESQSSSELVSVAATMRRSRISGRSGHKREPGTPPKMPREASASTTASAGLASLSVNSLKNCGVTSDIPLISVSLSASDEARAWLSRASRTNPSSPNKARWIVKARQQRPEFVQMLLVAFSRRMCCSRVERVST